MPRLRKVKGGASPSFDRARLLTPCRSVRSPGAPGVSFGGPSPAPKSYPSAMSRPRYVPAWDATCAVAGYGDPTTCAQSPKANTPGAPATRSHESTASRPRASSACAACSGSASAVLRTKSSVPMPAAHRERAYRIEDPSESRTSCSVTSRTPALSRTSMAMPCSSDRSFCSAASCKSPSNAISTLSDASSSTTRTNRCRSSYSRGTSCATKSRSSPHSSTPVGPAPITTKVSFSLRCSSLRPGSEACSKA
mmetsp:Transcript_19035/g.60799  ORF Transcript_19035/g.60799 Transcript_19035/m.60799 type:complete len:251 (+) Transcript_19035:369-1121(+)